MPIWDPKNPTIEFGPGKTVMYFPSDTHIGRGEPHDRVALRKAWDTMKRDKTPNKYIVYGGDMIEGHLYGHRYRNALEDEKSHLPAVNWPLEISGQLDEWFDYLLDMEFQGEDAEDRSALIMGNHDESAFRTTGDLFGMKFVRQRLKKEGKMPYYPGFEFEPTFKWPDGATLKGWFLHGGRSVASQKIRRFWDQPFIDERASRNLAQLLLYHYEGFAAVDIAGMGHTHMLGKYEPWRAKDELRTLTGPFGRPFWALNFGSFYRSHCSPWGDYHARGMSADYDVGYAKVTFSDEYHLVVEGTKRIRKVRTPDKVELVKL